MNIAILRMPDSMYYYHSNIGNPKTPEKVREMLYGLRNDGVEVCIVCDEAGALVDIKLNDTCPGYNYIKAVCAAFEIPMVECLYEGPYTAKGVAALRTCVDSGFISNQARVMITPMYQEELKETEAPC